MSFIHPILPIELLRYVRLGSWSFILKRFPITSTMLIFQLFQSLIWVIFDLFNIVSWKFFKAMFGYHGFSWWTFRIWGILLSGHSLDTGYRSCTALKSGIDWLEAIIKSQESTNRSWTAILIIKLKFDPKMTYWSWLLAILALFLHHRNFKELPEAVQDVANIQTALAKLKVALIHFRINQIN